MNRLANKVALVTGGSRGIGRAIAERLAADGAIVAVNYTTNAEKAAEVVKEIKRNGGAAFVAGADIAQPDQVEAMFVHIDSELARLGLPPELDILVNNAGVTGAIPLTVAKLDEIDRIMKINLYGTLQVTQRATDRLRDGGRIITISTGSVAHPSPRNGIYAMSKAALHAMTLALACELGPRSITVNAVIPGWTATDITASALHDAAIRDRVVASTALGRIGQPGDIAAATAFLASEDAQWVTGQFIEASGGYKLLPPV